MYFYISYRKMPFQSEKQRKLCWYLYHKAKQEGREPNWDCYEWSRHTPKNKKLPIRKLSKKQSKKQSKRSIKK